MLGNGDTLQAEISIPLPGAPNSGMGYGFGIRGANGAVTANIEGIDAPVVYARPEPDLPGLDREYPAAELRSAEWVSRTWF